MENSEITKQILAFAKKIQHTHGRNTAQENILKYLEINGQSSQKDLQNELNVKSGSISEVLSKLEKRGFITKSKSIKDARSLDLKISDLGKKKLTEIKRKGNIDYYESLSEKEKEDLLTILKKITK